MYDGRRAEVLDTANDGNEQILSVLFYGDTSTTILTASDVEVLDGTGSGKSGCITPHGYDGYEDVHTFKFL